MSLLTKLGSYFFQSCKKSSQYIAPSNHHSLFLVVYLVV